jgi:CBS domain-containing protein
MNASDIMVTGVITTTRDGDVQDVAKLLLANRISAVPVVDAAGKLVGMVSEGDLLRRGEAGTGHERAWWLRLLMDRDILAAEYLKEHSRKIADVMTRDVVVAHPETSVADIATLLERHRIKRVPIVRDGILVGVVSRANLIQALATYHGTPPQPVADTELREKLVAFLKSEAWVRPSMVNVTVTDGTVDLWGIVDSSLQKQALRVAVETTPGVKAINDNILVRPAGAGI